MKRGVRESSTTCSATTGRLDHGLIVAHQAAGPTSSSGRTHEAACSAAPGWLRGRRADETAGIRTGLKQAVGKRIDMIWPNDSSRTASIDPTTAGLATRVEAVADAIRSLKPHD
jgi:hypothetical protein